MTSAWSVAGVFALGLSFLIVGCAMQQLPNRPPTPFRGVAGPVIVAHRGGSLEVPENTVAAVRHGVEVGADWQEIDVTLSRDDAVIVIHDDTTARTTGAAGTVAEMTAAELTALPAGRPGWSEYGLAKLEARGIEPTEFGDGFEDARVPTLADILAIPGSRVMIEMKRIDKKDKLAEKVIDVVHRSGAADRVALASFDDQILYKAYSRDPSLSYIGIVDKAEGIDIMLQLPVSVLAVNQELAAAALAAAPPTVAVWTWTAYTVDDALAVRAQGVHGIITDVPKAVVTTLRSETPVHVEPTTP
jgi:glycerophosphoryl diester phosphodiesterase